MAQHEEIHCAQFPGSLVGPIFAEQIEVTIRHHALEIGLLRRQRHRLAHRSADRRDHARTKPCRRRLRGGCITAIVSPEGQHLAPPLTEGEGMVVADLDMALITKRKRMMDSVGHYARPELLSVQLDQRPAAPLSHLLARRLRFIRRRRSRHEPVRAGTLMTELQSLRRSAG